MKNDQVILVNEDNTPRGIMEKMEAHQKAELHRAFSIFIFNSKKQLLLQKRASGKYHSAGLWTNTCCSHPRPNEDTQAAAERRLKEELGIDISLMEIGNFTYIAHFDNGLTEHEFDHVFVAEYTKTPEHFNRDEISEIKWIKARDLEVVLKNQPQEFTPWLAQVLKCCLEYFSK